ncbi:hypothetical protein LCI18_010564 [Fusarium solani-melongenae]|uniref:Uncharacterized protein n=1 Tax=Fusarium solani subsp. cucurbitae TaxID=2747967 RepID=A0ACD3ZEC6_FUSSC|nr:hypothetical protein LCI18_010564 [Fusarium solani-melongenae]
MSSMPQNAPFRRILGPLAIIGTCYGLNSLLNKLVLNTRTGAHLWDWKKEIVLITGGSGGMGSHMVKQFAQKNIQQALPANARFYQVDVTSPDAIHNAAEQIRRDVGDPTVLINNAGVVLGKDILSCSKDQVRHMFDVNILAHFWLSQEFLPSMIKQQHGHIVTMASIASFITIASNVDYSCTKAGLTAFHEGLAQDLKHRYNTRNVLTSIIYPYWVRTPLIRNLTAHPTFHDPLDEPDKVAKVVVDHVMGCKSGRVVLPAYGVLLAGLAGFPLWLQELIRDSKASVLRDTTF